uniref:Uncharacterized protein n=1 Tax=viral metagenome TaxID=1070528 RepID=A0A6C0H6N9_9ZZZZ
MDINFYIDLIPIIFVFGVFISSIFLGSIIKGTVYILFIISILGLIKLFSFSDLPFYSLSSVVVMWFSFSYLITPLFLSKQKNIPIIVFIILLIVVQTKKLFENDFKLNLFLLLSFIGLFVGFIISFFIYSFGNKNVLFISDSSSNSQTYSQQTFKCNVYKNGELISNNNEKV